MPTVVATTPAQECVWCGQIFIRKPKGRGGRFCSDKCRLASWRMAQEYPLGAEQRPRLTPKRGRRH
jgi:hypothetical protein